MGSCPGLHLPPGQRDTEEDSSARCSTRRRPRSPGSTSDPTQHCHGSSVCGARARTTPRSSIESPTSIALPADTKRPLCALQSQIDLVDDPGRLHKLHLERARIFEQRLELDGRAISALEDARHVAPADPETLSHLAALYEKLGRCIESAPRCWNSRAAGTTGDERIALLQQLAEPLWRFARRAEARRGAPAQCDYRGEQRELKSTANCCANSERRCATRTIRVPGRAARKKN